MRLTSRRMAEEPGFVSKLALVIGVMVVSPLIAPVRAQSEKPEPSTQTMAGKRSEFDAASIKPSASGSQGTYLRRQPGGLYTATNVTVRALIASAYLNEFPPKGRLILGGPSWIDSDHFDIQAKAADGNVSPEQESLMIQALLEDRFGLALHHETRQLPIYTLAVAKAGKTGPRLVIHSGDSKCIDPTAGTPPPPPRPSEPMPAYCGGFFMNSRAGDLRESGNGITMDALVQFLSQSVDRMVVNRTGLSGTFEFTIEFAPDTGPGAQPAADSGASDAQVPSIFTALQEQLGLKLESTTGPVEVLVIDHVEEPTPN